MLGHLIGRNVEELRKRASVFREIFSSMADLEPDEIISRYRERGMLVGTPEEIVEEINLRKEQGIQRIMLQTHDQTDMDALELFASDVMPHIQ
jgi:alkanesulfonate monooxygenase SsuD/methylene tetrahydromethanopterin reductase-like flavin-dependent oxidoreductase (luciferase family)